MTITIESDVSIPDTGRTRADKYPFSKMKVGDSFKVPSGIKNPKQIAATGCKRHKPWLFKAAQNGDGWRVWRTA